MKNNIVYKLVIMVIFTVIISVNIYNIDAAIYASKGDEIPKAEIQYDSEDNSAVFPESYKADIKALKEAHPNWTFMAVYTNLDWNETIKHESYEINEGISLVPMSYAASWKKDGKDYFQDGTWVIASKSAVAYALDPRNYLNEKAIFQFESLSCVEGLHTIEAVEKVLLNTDLETKYKEDESGKKVIAYPTYTNINNIVLTMEKTYAQIIYDAGLESGVSPIHIATRIIQETGGKLANGSICGTNKGYVGYYNFFNIGAVPGNDGNSAVTNGLITAKNNGWDTPEKSIRAGALTLYNSYIKYGQDTVYFQKFDVSNSKGNATMLYACQYMTNILAPTSEAVLTYNAYCQLGILDSSFVFYVPVYNNRPLEKAVKPGEEKKDEQTEVEIEEDKKEEEEKPEIIPVKEIVVSKSNYSIKKGKLVDITVKILPENATNKKYTISEDKKGIVKIDGNKVMALDIGEVNLIIKTEDGNCTTSIKVTVTEDQKFTVDKEKLKIDENGVITNMSLNSKIEDITMNIKCDDSIKIECRNMSSDLLNNDSLVGTGTSITLIAKDSTIVARYYVLIKGDVNGDGKITASDYVLIKNSIMGLLTIKDLQISGADVNKDGKVTASDYVLIKNHIMGTSKLY